MKHVHQFLRGTSSRTLLMLHGTGGNEESLLGLARALDLHANVLSPRGNVLEGSAPRFFRRLAEGVFDLEDLVSRTHDLADFISEAAVHYGFDPGGVLAVGYSNGANIAASCLLLRPQALAGGVLVRAMVPLKPDVEPSLVGKRVLMLTGRLDPIVPIENANELARMLGSLGAEVAYEVLTAGHELTRLDLSLAQAWLG